MASAVEALFERSFAIDQTDVFFPGLQLKLIIALYTRDVVKHLPSFLRQLHCPFVIFRGRALFVTGQCTLVVRFDDLGDVWHAGVADFHSVAVENLVEF